MTDSTILKNAKENFLKAFNVPYPDGLIVGSWWTNIQKKNFDTISTFQNCSEAILYAQEGSITGFDHRSENAEAIIDFKLREIEKLFPGFCFNKYKNLSESSHSDPKTVTKVNGIPYSNIFLTHVNYYLRSSKTYNSTEKLKRIVEIGGGYGALARIYKLMAPEACYTIVDLPESLFFAQIFLQKNFPDKKFYYMLADEKINFDEYDFILVPAQNSNFLNKEYFNIAINTGSLQEMPDSSVKYWMNFIQNVIEVNVFYSFNYFLNNKSKFSETSKDEANLICPILDPFWKIKYFRINPKVITIDCSGRNWLELCAERLNLPHTNDEKLKQKASFLFHKAKLHLQGTDEWFEYLFMAIWCKAHKEYIAEMINGIQKYKLGFGATNNICREASFTDVLQIIKWFMRSTLKKVLFAFSPGDKGKYGEELFYHKLLTKIDEK